MEMTIKKGNVSGAALQMQEEQELNHYLTWLSGILDSSNDLILAIDRNYNIVTFNSAYQKEFTPILLKSIEEGMSLEEAFSNRPDEFPQVFSYWRRAIDGEKFSSDWDILDANLDRKYYKLNYNSIRNQRGEIIGATLFAQKETQLKEKPEGKDQVQEFVLLANSMPEIVWVSGEDGGHEFINTKAVEYSGLSNNELLKEGWKKFVHPDDLNDCHDQLQKFRKNGEPFEMEYRLLRKDGTYRWFSSRTVPLKIENGEVTKFMGSAIDIHEQKLLVEKLEQKAEELQQITEAIPQLVWTTEPNGKDSYFNRRWYEYTGLSMEESRSNGWLLAVHPDDLIGTERQWERSLITGEPFSNEYRCRKEDGTFRWFVARAVPLRDAQGNIIRWFGTCTDNHDQKLQRDELNKKNQKLFQINHYLDEFVHAVAHDLRSPVAGLKLSFELLNQVEESKKEKIMKGCKTYLDRLDNTLQGLVQLIEVQEDPSLTHREILDLPQMIDQVVEDLQQKLQAAGASIKYGNFEWNSIRYPKPYLYNILRNIFRYALRFRHPDQELEFKVGSKMADNGFMVIEIKENGQGLDLEKDLKNLFKPFSHINKGSDRKGMGLAIVKHMVEKNGGKIEVKSSKGKGSRFRIFLKEYADK